jgi:hypothetical protein
MIGIIRLVLTVALAGALIACGGGGGSGSPAPPSMSPAPPSSLSYPTPQSYPAGTAIMPLTPTVTGNVTSYSVSPRLPPGLSIDATNGAISGTPTTPTAAGDYTITAQNAGGSTTFKLSIAVIAVTATPANLARIVASGTPVTMTVSVKPVEFAWVGTLSAVAADTAGMFSPSVTISAGSGGAYTLTLTTSTTVAPDHYVSGVTIHLCSDATCNTPQPVPTITVPFDVNVVSASSSWPGNNLTPLSAWSGVSDWSTFQGNSAHTGYVPVDLDPNQFTTRWQVPVAPLNSGNYANLNSVTTSNGQLFHAAGNNLLFARKEFDGSVVWQYDFSGLAFPSVNPPSVSNGVVYIVAGQQSSTYMYALNDTAGLVLFKSAMSSQWEHYLAPTIGPLGVYTNAGTYGGIYGFDTTGTQLFFTGLTQTSIWTPAVDATHVYTYTGDALRVLDPANGSVLTTIADPTFVNSTYEIDGSSVLGAPGSVLAVNHGYSLIDFNTNTSSISWKVAGLYPATPAYHAAVIYVVNNNPLRLEARSEADGSLLWSWTPPQPQDAYFTSEVLITNNMAFVCTNLATYAVDTQTHELVWSYPLTGRLALSASGVLYIAVGQPFPSALTAINVK